MAEPILFAPLGLLSASTTTTKQNQPTGEQYNVNTNQYRNDRP